jgi:hypothetical protein
MVHGGRAALLLLILSSAASAAFAQASSPTRAPVQSPFQDLFQGTPEEQAACRPDSNRYCRDAEPDVFRVLACLQRNKTKISAACRRVLENHGQ